MRFLAWLFVRVAFRLRVKGIDNIPREGGVLVAPNHVSYLDPILAGCCIRRRTFYMARESLFRAPLFAAVMRWSNAFPVRRGRPAPGSFKRALSVLRSGDVLVMFPEGTRSETGRVQEGQRGFGMVASLAGVPVVPVYIAGAFDAMPRGTRRVRFVRVTVEYGEPIMLAPKETGKRDRRYEEACGRVIQEIRRLEEKHCPQG